MTKKTATKKLSQKDCNKKLKKTLHKNNGKKRLSQKILSQKDCQEKTVINIVSQKDYNKDCHKNKVKTNKEKCYRDCQKIHKKTATKRLSQKSLSQKRLSKILLQKDCVDKYRVSQKYCHKKNVTNRLSKK